jgi:uncharacterized protein YutE (UPF0331/DUF86 family)
VDEYLAILDELHRYDLNEFLANPERYGSTERFLQLAIEALLDVGSHVIAELGLGTIETYSDVPRIFTENKYLEPELARGVVYQVLQHQLDDLRALKQALAQFL